MAYLDDDFQGYSIGTALPFGSWTGGGFFAAIFSEPDTTGVAGTDRALGLQQATAVYDRTTAACLSTFSVFFATKHDASTVANTLFTCANGPNGSGHSFDLFAIRVERDGSITALCPTSNEILANSYDALYRFYTYNFLQINVTFTDVVVSGTSRVHIKGEVAMNGVSILTFDADTLVGTAQLANTTSEANIFELNDGDYGAFTLDTLKPIVTYPHPGSPKLVAYQGAIEVDVLPDSAKLQAIQAVLEVDVLPDSTKLQVFQMVVEVDIKPVNRWHISES